MSTHEVNIQIIKPHQGDAPSYPQTPHTGNVVKTSPEKVQTEGPFDYEEKPLVNEASSPTSPVKGLSKHKPVTLTFKNLAYSVQVKNNQNKSSSGPKFVQREILRSMTGICRPGELTAIMGASGAGKTTLLNILSVRATDSGKNKLTGQFLANGQQYNIGKFSKFAGYVMQNDILLETMTPREIFQFTADLRLSNTLEERRRKVKQLIQDLKLERASNTLVGGTFTKGISGGERKRTSIGVELITDPNLLFLDEPTSGLDSFTAFILIRLLKNLAITGGKTIIFTIHQPSSDIFFMFDNLMILAKGKFLYQGPTRLAVDHFGAIGYQCPEYTNPADYFIEITHSDGTDDAKFERMYQAYDATIAKQIENEVDNTPKKELSLAEKVNGFYTSTKLITKRSFLNYFRNPVLLKGRLGSSLFICFLICVLYFQLSKEPDDPQATANINGCIFFFGISSFMASAMSVVLTFPSERAVFLREYSANMYSVSSYYFGRSFVEIPFVVGFTFMMAAICYYIVGFNDNNAGKFFIFALVMIFQSLAGNALGLMVGSAFSDPKVATNVVPAVILPWMLFAGFYINSNSMPDWLGWIQYTSPFRYTLEAAMWNEYEGSKFGTTEVSRFGYNIGLWGAFGLLVAVGTIVRFVSLFMLKKLVRKLE